MKAIVNVFDVGDGQRYKVSYDTDAFQVMLSEARNAGLSWKKEEKLWHGNYAATLSFIESVSAFAEVYPKGILDKIKKVEIVPERVPLSIPFKKSLLARTPLPSKNGGISFQTEDIISGISQNVFAFYLEQGMGKSFISLSVMNHLREYAGVKNTLIVCEPTGIYNWRRYVIDDCLGRIRKEDILIVTKDNRQELGTNKYSVVICSFNTFRLCIDYFKKGNVKDPRKPVIPFQGDAKEWMLIIDESQNIGNNASRQTKALIAHKSKFFYRYLLSGTPAINSPLKYFSQMELLDESIFLNMTFSQFKNRIANVGTAFSEHAVASFKKSELVWLFDRMKPVVSRRRSEDFLQLPEHIIKKIYCEMPEKQAKIYEGVLNSELVRMKEIDGYLDAQKVRNKFPYFHLALDNPTILDNIEEANSLMPELAKAIQSFNLEKEHGKVLMLKELLSKHIDEDDEKVVVWSGHPKTIEQLTTIFAKYNPKCIHGQMEIESGKAVNEYRDNIIEDWKKDKNSKLLILSYITSSTSINLTQAKHQIFFDRSYNAVYFDQAIKRLHRTGQDRDVITEILIFDDTLDNRLDKNLEDKKEIDADIFKFKKGAHLSAEQWENIFSGKA